MVGGVESLMGSYEPVACTTKFVCFLQSTAIISCECYGKIAENEPGMTGV